MATRRLNAEIRQFILNKLLKEKFGTDDYRAYSQKQKDAFNKKWSTRVYNALYPTSIRRRMQALPVGFFVEQSHVSLYSTAHGSCGTSAHVDFGSRKLLAYRDQAASVNVGSDDRLKDLRDDLVKDMKELNGWYDTWQSAYNQALQCLNQFKTAEQLKKEWPEAFALLPAETKQNSFAIMIPPKSINELFGLAAK